MALVTPAKAGVHANAVPDVESAWMPAFDGMTVEARWQVHMR
jgi:hypothetical protein